MWNRRNLLSLAALTLTATAAPAWAQASFPSRPMTMVVPFPAGGITDAIARILALKVGEQLGKPVVSSNTAALRACLRALGIRTAIEGAGQLLRQ